MLDEDDEDGAAGDEDTAGDDDVNHDLEEEAEDDGDDPHRFLLEEDSRAPSLVREEHPRNLIGGRIEIFDKIGEGGMGAVWRGLHLKLERHVAVKVLDEALQLRADSRERFIREAQALASLDHPGVVRVYDCDQFEGSRLFLCMELLEGETLREVIRRGRLDPLAVIDIGLQVSDAVEAAHQRGILHRDLSPSNIMRLRDARTIKVIDWGLCKYLDLFYVRSTRRYGAPPGSRMVTPLGARFGTPEYMAPEMILRDRPGPPSFRTDVYALGVVLYELLAGQHPFAPGDRRTPRPLREALPGFKDDELEAVLREALCSDPEARTQTMADLQRALEGARQAIQARLAADAVPPGEAVGTVSRRESPTLAGGLAAVAVLPSIAGDSRPRSHRWDLGLALIVGAALGALGTLAAQQLGDPRETGAAGGERVPTRARAAEVQVDRDEAGLGVAEGRPPAIERKATVEGSGASPAPPPTTELLASQATVDAGEAPRRARVPGGARAATFAEVMARLEPRVRACARAAGLAEAPITVQVRHKGAVVEAVRVLRLSKEHPFSTCVEPVIRRAKPPPGTSPIADFTFFTT